MSNAFGELSADDNTRVVVRNTNNPAEDTCLTDLRIAGAGFDKTHIKRTKSNPGGTYQWFLSHGEYRKWADEGSSKLLWIHGKPGSGKSTLARFLADDSSPLE